MKKTLGIFVLGAGICLHGWGQRTTYYSQGSGDPAILSVWNSGPSGGGSSPASLTADAGLFMVQSGHILTTTTDMDFGTTGSVLEIGSGGILAVNHIFSLKSGSTLQSVNGGTLLCGSTAEISGSGNFLLADGATLKTAHSLGLNGSITVSGSKTLNPGGIYEFNGTAAQVTGAILPSPVGNLIIGNAFGVSLSNDEINVTAALLIRAEGKLVIDVGKRFTVESLSNLGGEQGLVIKSDAGGSGSLKHNSAGVQATVERYISSANWSNGTNGWHLISSPVASEPIQNDWTPSGTGNDYDFYAWSEASAGENWLNQKIPANNISQFEPGKGYLVAYETAGIRSFGDILNAEDVPVSGLTHTPGRPYAGWHLLGNPFACAIQWGEGLWNKSDGIGSYAQVWSSEAKSYKVLSGAGIIPAMNGFMVYNSEGEGSLNIPADARVHSDSIWYKSNGEQLLITAADMDNGGYQETVIHFSAHAQTGFHAGEDCLFMPGFAPAFYSGSTSFPMALNTLPDPPQGTTIPLCFSRNTSAHFTINLKQSITGVKVILTDQQTGQTVNLSEQKSYSFTSGNNDDPERFLLHFSGMGHAGRNEVKPMVIHANNGMVYIWSTDGLPVTGDVFVYDLPGRLTVHKPIEGQSLARVDIRGANGYNIVKVVTKAHTITRKVFIGP